ncbi:MAG: hypothetical protein ACR2M1_08265 [Gemmatimonadaceae bacterium]
MSNTISEVTRRAIADFWMVSEYSWSGQLTESAFMTRLYDLASLPSHDHRLRDAAGDIRQHRESFTDWEEDWPFTDDRFRLLWCPDDTFLRFLCEAVHPIVRPDAEQARSIARELNAILSPDGWQLIEKGNISGRPLFSPMRPSGVVRPIEEPTGWPKVDRQLQEVRARLDAAKTEEQCQSVGLLCREVLISTGQAVYDASRHKTLDGVEPSDTAAKRLLEAIFETELAGSVNEEARAHARAAVRLALALQHKRTADYRTAALCAEAITSVVNLAAIVAQRR